jgi:predicted nucleotidyltransferase
MKNTKNRPKFNIIQNKLKHYFAKREEILFAFLFGSTANDKTTGISDIDIAIMLDESKIDETKNPYGYKAELLAKLISVLSFNDIDLIILNEASLLLKHRIVQSGREIYTKDEKLSAEFRVKVMEQFLDLKPAGIY